MQEKLENTQPQFRTFPWFQKKLQIYNVKDFKKKKCIN